MRIKSVEFENWCQHKSRNDNLCSGLVGIIGPNGSGKSNYIKGILFALTGSSGNYGKKEDDLSWGETTGYVKVGFHSGGHEGTIKRWIKVAKCHMEFAGMESRTATQAEEAIVKSVGLNFKVLRDMIFVPQGRMESLLFVTPSERAKEFQMLFGTAHAENIRSALQLELVKVEGLTRPDARSVEELTLALSNQIKTGKEYELAKRNLERDLPTIAKVTAAKELCVSYEDYPRKKKELENATQMLERYKKDLDSQQSEKAKLSSELETKEEVIKDFNNDYISSKEALAKQRENENIRLQRTRLLKVIEGCEQVLSVPEPPSFSKDQLAVLEAKGKELSASELLVESSFKIVSIFDRGGSPKCPTCLQDVPSSFVAQQRSIYHSETERVKVLRAEVKTLRDKKLEMDGNYSKWKSDRDAYSREYERAKESLASYPDPGLLDAESMRSCEELVTMYESTASDVQKLKVRITSLNDQISKTGEYVYDLDRRVSKAGKELGPELPVAVYDQAKELLRKYELDSRAILEFDGKISGLQRTVSELTSRITEVERTQTNVIKYKKWKDVCERTREVFHRDNLPQKVAASYLGAINCRLSKYLELFGVRYGVKINDGLEIVCSFGDQMVPAERLSGGQKVELSLAFRFAIYDLFSKDLGLLVLDEPTVFLDKDRIESVAKLMTNVRSYSQSAGLQVIVVTHEDSLAEICDLVVRV